MRILLPMDIENVQEASLVKLEDVKVWAQMFIEEGQVVEVVRSE